MRLHSQLRDVIICPRERGIVNYVQWRSIVEHNLLEPEKPPRTLAQLAFLPNTLASLPVPGTDHTLLAAGGQDAEIHLSLLTPESKSLWQYNTHLEGSINNSILLTSLSLTDSNESSVEPRMAVSNNDRVVMFFDVPVRTRPVTISPVGAVRFNVPVNHCESSSILLVFFCPQDPSANLHVCSWSSWKQGVKNLTSNLEPQTTSFQVVPGWDKFGAQMFPNLFGFPPPIFISDSTRN